jgi:hypothetical protein
MGSGTVGPEKHSETGFESRLQRDTLPTRQRPAASLHLFIGTHGSMSVARCAPVAASANVVLRTPEPPERAGGVHSLQWTPCIGQET